MKKRYHLLLLTLLCAVAAQSQIQHPTAWLRADSAVLNAPSWIDVSGNGYNATPSSGTMPAAYSRMNFNKCFEVNGTETYALPLGTNNSRQSDVIVVYETYDTVNENALWQVQLDSSKRIGQTTRRILNDNGEIIYDTANRMKPVINYLAQSWRTPEVCAPRLTLCTADSLPLNGRIAEAMYFAAVLRPCPCSPVIISEWGSRPFFIMAAVRLFMCSLPASSILTPAQSARCR